MVDPKAIGNIMAHAFPESAHKIEIFRHPLVIDAPSNACLGWFLYSAHKMHSEDYTQTLAVSLLQKRIDIDP